MNLQNKPTLGWKMPAQCFLVLSAAIAVLVSVLVGEKAKNFSNLFLGE